MYERDCRISRLVFAADCPNPAFLPQAAGADAVLPKVQAREALLRLLYGDAERSALPPRPHHPHDARRATSADVLGQAGHKRRD